MSKPTRPNKVKKPRDGKQQNNAKVMVAGKEYMIPKAVKDSITHLMTEYETNIKISNETETNRIGILAAAKMLLKHEDFSSDEFKGALEFLRTKVEEAGDA
jgi:hypothetical protein